MGYDHSKLQRPRALHTHTCFVAPAARRFLLSFFFFSSLSFFFFSLPFFFFFSSCCVLGLCFELEALVFLAPLPGGTNTQS
mgnify:FL=1